MLLNNTVAYIVDSARFSEDLLLTQVIVIWNTVDLYNLQFINTFTNPPLDQSISWWHRNVPQILSV
jgi:hypothetical protein